MTRRVVVIGAGFAGTAAAYAAAQAGARVELVHAVAGASSLYSGAVDGEAVPSEAVRALAERLSVWSLGSRFIASAAGVVRRAWGADAALLKLDPLAGKRIAVADVDRDEWQADLLARGYSDSEWARRTQTVFEAVPVNLLQHTSERRICAYDFAKLHDDPRRRSWACDNLKRRGAGVDAWLFGPWLGVHSAAAPAMSARLSCPVGETTSPPGGPAGARFEAARDSLLGQLGVQVRVATVQGVYRAGAGWNVSGPECELEAEAVVLALGGVAAGGIRLRGEGAGANHGFELSLQAPVSLQLDGDDVAHAASLRGFDFVSLGHAALERVGVAARRTRVRGQPGLFAAGDVVSGGQRTVLGALEQGIVAGTKAAADPALSAG